MQQRGQGVDLGLVPLLFGNVWLSTVHHLGKGPPGEIQLALQFVCPWLWLGFLSTALRLVRPQRRAPLCRGAKFFIVQLRMQSIGAMCCPRRAPMQCSMLSEKSSNLTLFVCCYSSPFSFLIGKIKNTIVCYSVCQMKKHQKRQTKIVLRSWVISAVPLMQFDSSL